MNVDDDILGWVEYRVSRLYWLAGMRDAIEGVEKKNLDDCEVYDFFMNHLIVLSGLRKKLLEGSSCIPDCRALCCYLSKDYSNRIPIATHELEALKDILTAEGRICEDYYTIVPLDMIDAGFRDYLGKMPDFIFTADGVQMVYMLNLSDRFIDQELLKHIPKSVKKSRRMRVDRTSRACIFLDDEGKCTLYGKLRFIICREFFCLTAVTMIILRQLGLVDDSVIKLPLGRLNMMSNDIATAFRSSRILDWEGEYDDRFRELAISYVTGGEVKEEYRKLREFEKEYESMLTDSIKKAMESY